MKQRNGLSIKVTSNCQRLCGKKCGVSSWMDRKKGYDMPFEHIVDMVGHAISAGYLFEFIIFTGGEPFLWPWLEDSASLIKRAKITKVLTVYTNGLEVERIKAASRFFDHIKITKYPYNSEQIKSLISLPNTLIKTLDYWHSHSPEPLPETLPADCGCAAYAMQGDRFYLCSVQPILEHTKKGSIPLKKNFLEGFKDEDPFNRPICQYCFGNLKVQRIMKGESHERDRRTRD